MYKKGDFHIHSTASDGTLEPKEVVRYAKKNDIDIMALSDHDTIKGINEAQEEGKKLDVKVIPAIELSTQYKNESIHILGYFKNGKYENKELDKKLEEMHNYRIMRAKKMAENLKKYFGIEIDFENMLKKITGNIARPHIARAVLDAGYNYSFQYVFDNLIGTQSPAYVPNTRLSIEDGIKLLKKSNAIVVLAHPVLIKKSSIDEMLKFDFDGIEAIYPRNTKEDTIRFKAKAKEYKKLITAGSDFHGISGDPKHGDIGYVSLSENGIENFLNALQ